MANKRVYTGENVVRKGQNVHLPSLNKALGKYPNICKVDVEINLEPEHGENLDWRDQLFSKPAGVIGGSSQYRTDGDMVRYNVEMYGDFQ